MDARQENGASAVEYALLVALIAVVVLAVAVHFGRDVADLYSSVPEF